MAKLNISLIDFLNFEEKKLIKDSDLMENGEKVSDLDIIWTWGISQSTARQATTYFYRIVLVRRHLSAKARKTF